MRNVEGITNMNKMANANRLGFTFLSGSGTAGHTGRTQLRDSYCPEKVSHGLLGHPRYTWEALELVPATRMQQVQVNATPSYSL